MAVMNRILLMNAKQVGQTFNPSGDTSSSTTLLHRCSIESDVVLVKWGWVSVGWEVQTKGRRIIIGLSLNCLLSCLIKIVISG